MVWIGKEELGQPQFSANEETLAEGNKPYLCPLTGKFIPLFLFL